MNLKYKILLAFYFALLLGVRAQVADESKPLNHDFYVEKLTSSVDSEYVRVIKMYDTYIAAHPDDYLIQIQRCRFMDNAYSEYEEYNSKYEEAEECRNQLTEDFPEAPEVVLYNAEYIWGDSVIPFCKRVIENYESNSEKWKNGDIWIIYDKLASAYSSDKEHIKAIRYAELTLANNDTLDRSLFLAEQYKELKQPKKAIELLAKGIDPTDDSWELNQKGKLLLELGAADRAIIAFRWAQKDTNAYQDAAALAQALIDNGLYKDARSYLVKAADTYYDKAPAYLKLFDYDIKYGNKDSALATYHKLVEGNFANDPVGINRLRLFFHAPLLGWSAIDLLRILLLPLLILVLALSPYLWVLPIHYIGTHFKTKGMFLPPSPFRWGLRHVWVASSVLLLADIVLTLIFFNGTLPADDDVTYTNASQALANVTLFHSIALLIVTALLIRPYDIQLLWGNFWEKRQSIFTGIGMALVLKFSLGIYLAIFGLVEGQVSSEPGFLTLREDIISVNKFYHPVVGFIMVVLLVPVYEEILFRGVLLSGFEKYMKFALANSLQALFFALIHMDWKLMPFFFLFGMVAGHYRQKSQSLAPGISMHMTNNFLAFVIYLVKA